METDIKVEDKDTTGAGVDRAPFRRGAMKGSAGAALDPTPAPKPDNPDYGTVVAGRSIKNVAEEMPTHVGPPRGASLLPDLSAATPDLFTQTFWLGTLPSCPRAVVHLGGQDFPEFTDPEIAVVGRKAGAQPRRAFRLGRLARLTAAQVTAIEDALKRRVVRGKDIYSIHTPRDIEELKAQKRYAPFQPQAGDEGLARHVFMVRQEHCGEQHPPSLYETGIDRSGFPGA